MSIINFRKEFFPNSIHRIHLINTLNVKLFLLETMVQ